MKKSFFYLGIAVILFSNVISALNCQQSFNNENRSLTQNIPSNKNTEVTVNGADSIEKKNTGQGGESTGVISEELLVNLYQKTMEEIIAENNQIIESNQLNAVDEPVTEDDQVSLSIISAEVGPVYSKKTTEEIIMEDRQIIESPVFCEIPLHAIKKSSKS